MTVPRPQYETFVTPLTLESVPKLHLQSQFIYWHVGIFCHRISTNPDAHILYNNKMCNIMFAFKHCISRAEYNNIHITNTHRYIGIFSNSTLEFIRVLRKPKKGFISSENFIFTRGTLGTIPYSIARSEMAFGKIYQCNKTTSPHSINIRLFSRRRWTIERKTFIFSYTSCLVLGLRRSRYNYHWRSLFHRTSKSVYYKKDLVELQF